MRVGWLVDQGLPVAGMVLQVRAYEAAKPDDVQLVHCAPNKRPPGGIDAYIYHGDLYDSRWVEIWKHKPLMAHRHGGWVGGDPVARRWVLDNADLVTFNSPKQRELFTFPVNVPTDFVPTPIDVDAFREAASKVGDRSGTVYVGLIVASKGIARVMDWAMRTGTAVDFWGAAPIPMTSREIVPPGNYCGTVEYGEIPDLLARYENFVFMPFEPDLYSRTVIEAAASGCNLIVEGDTDALYDYLDLDACRRGGQIFWEKFRGVMDGR